MFVIGLAARLLGRTGNPTRLPTAGAFAQYAGTAPIKIASADRARHRLSTRGDRQLNAALHTVAITQIRMRHSPTSTASRSASGAPSPRASADWETTGHVRMLLGLWYAKRNVVQYIQDSLFGD
ncbi:transposase [Streptomyces sp. NPDC007095]|uniref:transposase n=1 Tax=Streptomyces sp. NPDC007095 TaxID=3154482 RepID=UPI0026B41997